MTKSDAGFSKIERALNDLKSSLPNALALEYAQPLFDHYQHRCRELGVEPNHGIRELFSPRTGKEFRGGKRDAVLDLGDVVIVRLWEKEPYDLDQIKGFTDSVERALSQKQSVIIDFSRLHSTNSTFFGKIASWHAQFQKAGLVICFCHIPDRFRALLAMSRLDKVFVLADDHLQALEKVDQLVKKSDDGSSSAA